MRTSTFKFSDKIADAYNWLNVDCYMNMRFSAADTMKVYTVLINTALEYCLINHRFQLGSYQLFVIFCMLIYMEINLMKIMIAHSTFPPIVEKPAEAG